MSRSRVRGAVVLLGVTASAAACVSATNAPPEPADGSFEFDASGFDGNVSELDSALLRDSSVAEGASDASVDATMPDSADSAAIDAAPDRAAIDSGPDGTSVDSATAEDASDASVDAADAAVPGTVTTIAGLQLSTFRQGHNATLLPDGRVIFCGGYYGPSGSIASCDLFDPMTNTMSLGPAMNVGRQGQMATLLPSGELLLAGGTGPLSDGGFNTLQSAEILDPAATSFTLVSNPMAQARSGAAVLLAAGAPNAGKVLLIGGYGDGTIDSGTPNDLALGTSELFDPGDASTQGTFTLSAPLSVRRGSLVAAPLPNGGAIAAGGSYGPGGGPYTYLDTAETIGPGIDGGFVAAVNTMSSKRQGPQLTVLLDGRVFIMGGYGPTGYAATADIFDPATRSFTSVTLPASRGYPALATLQSGRVLIAGGVVAGVNSGDVEIYDPATGAFRTASGTLSPARSLASATTLQDGRVIIAGGQGALGIVPSVDIFTEQ